MGSQGVRHDWKTACQHLSHIIYIHIYMYIYKVCVFYIYMCVCVYTVCCWTIKCFCIYQTTRPFRYDLNQIPYDYTVKVSNIFKGLDLIDREPDELWTEVRDIVQETRTIPMQKKCKKAKWLSEEALQIAVKRREEKSKGKKERYSHLNAEFQRIARRDLKKASSAINANK